MESIRCRPCGRLLYKLARRMAGLVIETKCPRCGTIHKLSVPENAPSERPGASVCPEAGIGCSTKSPSKT
ncbi:Com family DNA-binding transcriptional regulator [Pacificispira sp.]|uniref:Com family DNA-binding transcriptional regulator n=1 Tax=Pacificispira sp. TaxID=2888761 RepID=UPI003BAA2A19